MQKKKICLIGKFNTITQGMNDYLSKYFNVQLCSDNLELVKGILNLSSPDLVVMNLIGLVQSDSSIFSEIKFNYPTLPCFCVGTASEQATFSQYFRNSQFTALTRPISNSDLLQNICDKLQLEIDAEQDIVIVPSEKRKHILLVDDNPLQLRALRGLLQPSYDVTMAISGAEAMVAIGKRMPDLIFLDYEMPVCDGKMTLEMIRNLEEAHDVPVVFLTGVRDRAHIKGVIDLKPAAYMLKPTTDAAIQEMVEKLLGPGK